MNAEARIETAEDLVRAMRESGSHYWDADTMRFFRSRGPFHVTPCKAGVLFCTSEQFKDSGGFVAPRKWSVRLWDGVNVKDVSEFNELTRHQAIALLKRKAKELGS